MIQNADQLIARQDVLVTEVFRARCAVFCRPGDKMCYKRLERRGLDGSEWLVFALIALVPKRGYDNHRVEAWMGFRIVQDILQKTTYCYHSWEQNLITGFYRISGLWFL
jgi:hypothetical protein